VFREGEGKRLAPSTSKKLNKKKSKIRFEKSSLERSQKKRVDPD